jgi:hypothetical protein
MVLYHVTPVRNLPSILRSGLKIAGSHKGRPVVWLCDRRHLLWTLGHVARWKQRDPASMRIVSVECEPGTFTGVRPGMYLSWTSIPAARIVGSFAAPPSQPRLERVALPAPTKPAQRITRPCTPVALSRARQWQTP